MYRDQFLTKFGTLVCFTPDASLMAAGIGGSVGVWRLRDSALVYELSGDESHVLTISISPDGALLASGGVDKVVKVWRLSDGCLLRTLQGHTNSVRGIAFSRTGYLASCGDVGDIFETHRFEGNYMKKQYTSSYGSVAAAAAYLCSEVGDVTVRVWRIADWRPVQTLTVEGGVISLVFSPRGDLMATGGWDEQVRIWSTSTWRLLRTLEEHESEVWSVAFSPDAELLASSSGLTDGRICLWRVSDGTLIRTCAGHSGGTSSITFDSHGELLVSCGYDSSIAVWRLADGHLLARYNAEGDDAGKLFSVALSPDGQRLAYRQARGAKPVQMIDFRALLESSG